MTDPAMTLQGDIVERLRRGAQETSPYSGTWDIGATDRIMAEAAAEIEALRAALANEKTQSRGDWASQREIDLCVIENAGLKSDVARALEAFERIAANKTDYANATVRRMAEIAMNCKDLIRARTNQGVEK